MVSNVSTTPDVCGHMGEKCESLWKGLPAVVGDGLGSAVLTPGLQVARDLKIK